MARIELYELDGCPYCVKVTGTLEELGLDYESHSVLAAHSEREQVREISGQSKVPVIVDEEHGVEGMNESDDIVRYLEETYGGGDTEAEAAGDAEADSAGDAEADSARDAEADGDVPGHGDVDAADEEADGHAEEDVSGNVEAADGQGSASS